MWKQAVNKSEFPFQYVLGHFKPVWSFALFLINCQDTICRVSTDAGLYFCEFRLYSSLAVPLLSEARREKTGKVTFVHLPQAHDPEAILLAKEVVCAFIKGLVDG